MAASMVLLFMRFLYDYIAGQFTVSYPEQWFPYRAIPLITDSYPLTQIWGMNW